MTVDATASAARFAGVNPTYVSVVSCVISSVCAVIAGMVLYGFVGRALLGMAGEYQFASIAAVIVGGASILGGRGHYLGTVAGVLLLTVLNALLDVLSLGAGSISIFYGLVILVSVWLAQQDLARVGHTVFAWAGRRSRIGDEAA